MKKKKNSFRAFLQFYRRFSIPWWMFLLSAVFGIVSAEITFTIAEYTIRVNKGELYNQVIVGYVLLTVLNCLIAVLENQLANYGCYKITLRARGVLWKKILHMKVKDVDEKNPSALISGVTIDVEQASAVISMVFLFVSSAYGFVKACAILYMYNASMSFYLLILIPLAFFVFWFVGKTQMKYNQKIYASYNRMTSFFSEHLSATKHVKAQVMEEREIEEGYRAIDTKYKADLIYAVYSTLQTLVYSIYSSLSTVFTCVFGAQLINAGKMESTGINNTSTYLEKINQYMAEILSQYGNIRGTQGALTQVNELFEMDSENPEEGKDFVESDNKDIVFRHVSFGYTDKEIMHDISFRIPYKKTVAIIGNNGSGKTTLIKLMQGLYTVNSGDVMIGENRIGEVKLRDVRKRFSYILQNDNLFSGTIRENICYGCFRDVTQEEIESAAKMADAHEFIMSLSEGYDTVLAEAGRNLSGGQRKRISFARAFLQDSDYFLLDEAGANLDKKSYGIIYKSLKEKMKEKTVIFIAHEMDEILTADYLLVLNDGKLEAFGTHEELLEKSYIYRDYISRICK